MPETAVGRSEARALLDRNEVVRVLDFVDGSDAKRELFIGSVEPNEFLGSFLLLANEETALLIQNGRSLQSVVDKIREMGGLARVSREKVPWLRKAVPLAAALDFELLAQRRMFVREATAEEAATSRCQGQGTLLEEGQHRAIAAAWNITGGDSGAARLESPGVRGRAYPGIPYLRGVNLQGAQSGPEFWDVGSTSRLRLVVPRCSAGDCALALLLCGAARCALVRCKRVRRAATVKKRSTGTRRRVEQLGIRL
jgi:hypothetical protein